MGSAHGPVVLTPQGGRGQRSTMLDALADAKVSDMPIERILAGVNRSELSRSQVMIVVSRAERLTATLVGSLKGACNHLTVIGADGMDDYFDDNPVPTREATCH